MTEVTVIGKLHQAGCKTIHRVKFVDEELLEKRFGSVTEFVSKYGSNRRAIIGGQPRYAVIFDVVKVATSMVKELVTVPVSVQPTPDLIECLRGRTERRTQRASSSTDGMRSTYKRDRRFPKVPVFSSSTDGTCSTRKPDRRIPKAPVYSSLADDMCSTYKPYRRIPTIIIDKPDGRLPTIIIEESTLQGRCERGHLTGALQLQ